MGLGIGFVVFLTRDDGHALRHCEEQSSLGHRSKSQHQKRSRSLMFK